MWTDCAGRQYNIPIPDALPCPFCGKYPVMECLCADEDYFSPIWIAQCVEGHASAMGNSVKEAASKWNAKAQFKDKDNIIALLNEKHKSGKVPGFVYDSILEFLARE